ncbi:hypothetical protein YASMINEVIRUS_855 [Yasminevirus sp. GU-2018]|uniref:Uncharacterized protein n=1 Tax=Yasminevirus sp. GU-2018 TaxID=2420051 RepID=A0A5K0UA71_9VIRU|nr:hypothetical protein YASMINEVIRUS_855 [Yasminevirus sp. GU-2018]
MDVFSSLTRDQVKTVFVKYCTKHFKIDSLFDIAKEATRNRWRKTEVFFMFNQTYSAPCSASFNKMLTSLLKMDVSYAVMYWVLAVIHVLCSKKAIVLDAYTIHHYVLMFHDLGMKLIEDTVYDSAIYMSAMNVDKAKAVGIEITTLALIFQHTTPYSLLFSGVIDDNLYALISEETGVSVEDIKCTNDIYKSNKYAFYHADTPDKELSESKSQLDDKTRVRGTVVPKREESKGEMSKEEEPREVGTKKAVP